MASGKKPQKDREHDFALIVAGVTDLTPEIESGLFEAGCDDATLSIQHGLLYMEFSRAAESLKEAILSAIRDVRGSGVGGEVLRVDSCELVTASDIARRLGRSRQLVHQYITGQRGPGGFPAPECHLADRAPLWGWCAVSRWLVANDLLRPEEGRNAMVVDAINTVLHEERQRRQDPKLFDEIAGALKDGGAKRAPRRASA